MIVLFEYQGSPIQLEDIDGQVMANATLMCKAFGKEPKNWLRNDQTQRYISAVAARRNSLPESLQVVRNGGTDYGTWIDEKLILNLARWLSPEFEIWCDDRLAELMRTGRTELAGRGGESLPQVVLDRMGQQAQSVSDMALCMQNMAADISEMRARLATIPIRDMKPQAPVPAHLLSSVAAQHIELFWDSLSRTDMDVMRFIELREDTQYILVALAGVWPAYLDYCATCCTEPLSVKDLKKCLSHRRYAPYLPVWGKYMTFRFERRGKELFVGGRHLPFLDEKVTG